MCVSQLASKLVSYRHFFRHQTRRTLQHMRGLPKLKAADESREPNVIVSNSSRLTVTTDSVCEPEKRYVLDWVLCEVLGIDYDLRLTEPTDCISITCGDEDRTLQTPQHFFALADRFWLQAPSLPESCQPFQESATDGDVPEPLPILNFGDQPSSETNCPGTSSSAEFVPFDLFGTMFFLISRYEEAVEENHADKHDRFPSSASALGKLGLLDRAIGNEYIEFLWRRMKQLWPGLQRKQRDFRLLPSHDVDLPSLFINKTKRAVLRNTIGELRRGGVSNFVSRSLSACRYYWGKLSADPFDTIDWIMERSESASARSEFFYIAEKSDALDPGIPLDAPIVRDQWTRIAKRGHRLGLHPGYATYDSPAKIDGAKAILKKQMRDLGIEQDQLGSRQHFLRWRTPETACHLEAAGIDYDSTLGYADAAGFRCGVCYEFPMYDLKHHKPLKIRQRPLVVMDCTVVDERYMNMGLSAGAHDYILMLKRTCQRFNGDFTILWHNDRLCRAGERDFYRSVLNSR